MTTAPPSTPQLHARKQSIFHIVKVQYYLFCTLRITSWVILGLLKYIYLHVVLWVGKLCRFCRVFI